MTRADDRNFATWADHGGMAPHRVPMMSDGRQMNPGPGNVWWCPEPAHTTTEFGPPLPSIWAVAEYLTMRANRLDEDDREAHAYELAAFHVEALEEQYADRFAMAVTALDELKILKRYIEGIGPGDKEGVRPTARSVMGALDCLLYEIGMPIGDIWKGTFPEDATDHPPSIDRQGVRANYGTRLADRLEEFMDTLDPSDAETLTIALHRDITDREES